MLRILRFYVLVFHELLIRLLLREPIPFSEQGEQVMPDGLMFHDSDIRLSTRIANVRLKKSNFILPSCYYNSLILGLFR